MGIEAMGPGSMTDALLGIGVGPGGARELLVALDGSVLDAALTEYPMATPAPGWAEQDPADWLAAAKQAVHAAIAPAGQPRVLAIYLTGQMHSLVPLDAYGAVVRPAILWCDQRTTAQCRAITAIV